MHLPKQGGGRARHLTILLCERAARSESLLSGIASTRLCRPPAAQQMTRHLSGPPAHENVHLGMLAAVTHFLCHGCIVRALTEQADQIICCIPAIIVVCRDQSVYPSDNNHHVHAAA